LRRDSMQIIAASSSGERTATKSLLLLPQHSPRLNKHLDVLAPRRPVDSPRLSVPKLARGVAPTPHYWASPTRIILRQGLTSRAYPKGMVVGFYDGVLRNLHEPLRLRLLNAEVQYREERTPETRQVYLRALKMFADLVLRYKAPEE